MKAKKPLLLAVLVVALLAVVLMLPATASGTPQDEGKVVYFHSLAFDAPDPPLPPLWDNPGGTLHWRDWLYEGMYFVNDPADPSPSGVLDPLTGFVRDCVSMNQTNITTKGTVWVGAEDAQDVEDGNYSGIWEFSGVCAQNDQSTGTTSYYAQGRGVAGDVKGWVLKFEVVIHWVELRATLDGYYMMK